MKKIIYTFVVISLLIGCKKDAELPALAFNFSVTESQQNFSDKGVNEAVTIDFDIKTDYDFTKVPLKYKIETTEQSEISDGIKKILPNDIYTLQEPKLKIIYTGKSKAEHKIKVTFENQKGFTIEKQFSLNYKEYGYKIDISQGNKTPYQGENVDFNLRITPENTSVNDFFIIFKSYDDQDPNLEKTLVALNGEKITFNKEYKIEDLSNINIRLNSFYIGAKQLKYVIKNSTFQREEVIEQNVEQNSIDIEYSQLDRHLVEQVNQIITFTGKVHKTPKFSNKLEYKTIIKEAHGSPNGLSTNDWKSIEMNDRGDITFQITALAVGSYKYSVFFRDEFGNQNGSYDDLTFSIDVKTEEDFNVQFSSSAKKVMVTKPFPFQLRITPKNHHQSVNYFIKFRYMKVIYNNKTYNEGENIPIQIDATAPETIFQAQGLFEENAIKSFAGLVSNTDNISKSIAGSFPPFFQPLILDGAYLRYSFWVYKTEYIDYGLWSGKHYYYRKGDLYMALSNYISIDDSINKQEVEYFIYLEKKGKGMVHIATVNHHQVSTSQTGTKIFEEDHGWGKSESNYVDNMNIIVKYKNQKIYEVKNIRNFWYGHNEQVKYIDFPQGKIYYENYENPVQ